METMPMEFIKKMENMADFLKERNAKKKELNNEIKTLTEKLEIEAENNKEKILFSIPFNETAVTFSRQQVRRIFGNNRMLKEELFLVEINIAHVEYTGDINLEYCSNIMIQFEFSDDWFNRQIALNRLGFNDKKQKISEQVTTPGFGPCFTSAIKYQEMKGALEKIREIMNTEEKKNEGE